MSSHFYWILLMCTLYHSPAPLNAQRPSYAGLSPGPGRTQLNKYFSSESISTTRFTTRPPGWTHSPLSPGTKVVMPEPVQQPLLAVVTMAAPPAGEPLPIDARGDFNQVNRLPIDARGDVYLINRLNQLPEDQRPFWFINYKAIEAHRNRTDTEGVLVRRNEEDEDE